MIGTASNLFILWGYTNPKRLLLRKVFIHTPLNATYPAIPMKAKARARGLMGVACIVAWWWHVGVAGCGPAKGRGKRHSRRVLPKTP